ncbi:hypothetical protein [Streptomyces sp. 3213.3]|uniref:hypothetical protein n=1 Tax=Streptomyces sp. 3213.3 TaxID=1855348 RepID=UPI00135C6001|nr:hypothetical protein [Streptomyces sp. 3213.3]
MLDQQRPYGRTSDAYWTSDIAPQVVGEFTDRPAGEGLGGAGAGRLGDEVFVVSREQTPHDV